MKLCRHCTNISVRKIEIEKLNDKGEKYTVDSFETFCGLTGEIKNHQSTACEHYILPNTYKKEEPIILTVYEIDILKSFEEQYKTVAVEGDRNRLHFEKVDLVDKEITIEGVKFKDTKEVRTECYLPVSREMFKDLKKFKQYSIKGLIRGEE